MNKTYTNNHKMMILVFLMVLFSMPLIGQELHPCGLILEDLSKSPLFKEYTAMSKANIPDKMDLSSFLPQVGNQASQGSCVAWSMGYYSKTFQEWKEHRWMVNELEHQASPAFMYNLINSGVDEGSSYTSATSLLVNYGCGTMKDMFFNEYDFTSLPSDVAYNNALSFRCTGAFYISTISNSGIRLAKQMISDTNVLTLGIKVFGNFDHITQYNYTYCVSERIGNSRGAHAITLIGYDDNKVTSDGVGAFKFVNSWGSSFGLQGFGWISYKAVMDPGLTNQQVVFTVNKIGYVPKVKARLNITHSSRKYITIQFGLGDPAAPRWIKNFAFMVKDGVTLGTPTTDIVYDLTECLPYVSASQDNRFFVKCSDTKKDGVTGKINTFKIETTTPVNTYTSTTAQTGIADSGYCVMEVTLPSMTPDLRIKLANPVNGQANIALMPVLRWNKVPNMSKYCLQISTVLEKFNENIFIDNDNISDTSYTISGLEGNKIYYWKVGNKQTNEWSDIYSFRTTFLTSNGGYSAAKVNYNWIDISSTGAQITAWENLHSSGVVKTSDVMQDVLDDGYSSNPIPVGFDFSFFGNKFNSLFVGINGLVSFTYKYLNAVKDSSFSTNGIGAFNGDYFNNSEKHYPNSIGVAVEDFDLNTVDGYGGGKILYKTMNDQFILSWENVGTFNARGDLSNSFQLVLDKLTNSITLNYKNFGLATTRNKIRVGIQKDETTMFSWLVTGAIPAENAISNQSSIKFTLAANSVKPQDEVAGKVTSFNLHQNYPNPFNPSTVISYQLPENSFVTLKIYDILGKEVSTLVSGMQSAGFYSLPWNAAGISSGIYYYRLSANKTGSNTSESFVDMKKLILLK
jgi:hypothetical protein